MSGPQTPLISATATKYFLQLLGRYNINVTAIWRIIRDASWIEMHYGITHWYICGDFDKKEVLNFETGKNLPEFMAEEGFKRNFLDKWFSLMVI